jgi:polysaccharide export outer membrane protein
MLLWLLWPVAGRYDRVLVMQERGHETRLWARAAELQAVMTPEMLPETPVEPIVGDAAAARPRSRVKAAALAGAVQLAAFALVILLSIVPASASAQAPAGRTPPATDGAAMAGQVQEQGVGPTSPAYLLGPGDVLKVEAFQQPEISGTFQIEESGDISYPLLGHVAVAGLPLSEVAARLERLLERDYYVDVQLQVEVATYRSKPVTVLGEVARPGTYFLRGPTTVTQVLAEAGGLGEKAGSEVELRRIEVVDGRETQQVQTLSADDLLSGDAESQLLLRAGDVLTVPARQLYFISGEVARPGQYEISPGMTLMKAISQAGGIGKFASQRVELHREGAEGKEMLEHDLSRIRKGKEPDVPIEPGDMIIVRRRFF